MDWFLYDWELRHERVKMFMQREFVVYYDSFRCSSRYDNLLEAVEHI